ncbi:MAG: ribose-phosphate diphosphokinase [Candidatus Altiarchaeales archaeon]|nr:ribose-phosphate diphosphokinase [Candidatus Altiarchaeales archaeon]
MIVFGGSSSVGLAWDVSKDIGAQLGKNEVKRFPDGEIYVKINSEVKNQDCAVIQSVRSSDNLVELFLFLDALKDQGAREVAAVMPYMAYSRQDKVFTKGEALSAKTILKLVDELSSRVVTVNTHFMRGHGDGVYHKIRFRNLDAIPSLISYLKVRMSDPTVIAPDEGSLGMAKYAAELLGCDFDHIKKKRISGEEVRIETKSLNVRNKDVLILDDIISTGNTIAKVADFVGEWRPKTISVACIHALFTNGMDMFKGKIDRLIATNTVESSVSKVNVGPLIAKELREVLR